MTQESRQGQIISADVQRLHVAVVGLGTVGSWLVPLLVKLGVGHVEIWDDDKVEEANTEVQIYGATDKGVNKAEALVAKLLSMQGEVSLRTGQQISFHPERMKVIPKIRPNVVISCVDNWTGRRLALEWAVKARASAFIEARMIARYRIVHAIRPSNKADVAWLIDTFGDDKTSTAPPCGVRGAAFLGASAASEIAAVVCNLVNGEDFPREMPYELSVHLPIAI